MYSLHSHPLILPSPPNTQNPNSQPRIDTFFLQHSSPPETTFSDALLSLRKSTENQDSKAVSCFHARILKLGLQTDVFIGNSLLNMYSRTDQLKSAQNLFDHMPHRTIASWTSMMSAYHRSGLADEAISVFLRMLESLQPNEFALSVLLQACASTGDEKLVCVVHSYAIKCGLISDTFLQNSLMDAYSKSGKLAAAEKLLRRVCSRDVVSWTCVVSGCVRYGDYERALALFRGMLEDGIVPNDVAMVTVLKACLDIDDCKIMRCVHGFILKGEWCLSGLVLNALIEMYSVNGHFTEAMTVFSRFYFSNEGLYPSRETMANLLQGCGSSKIGAEVHGYLVKHGFLPCTIVENSLMDAYAENGDGDSALLLFRTMATRDVVSWNTMIKCFVKSNQPVAALGLLTEIHREGSRDGVSMDFVTLLTSLRACSDMAMLLQGQVIHGYVMKTGLLGDIFVQNALIDMYGRSGRLHFAKSTFREMRKRDIGSWNSMIVAYGINGKGASALKLFTDLERSESRKTNVMANAITFVNILSACAHGGFVEEGLDIFNSMEKRHGIRPGMEHFACIVDLLGRAGRVEEAEEFIARMPVKPGADVWGALLSACVLVGNVDVAEKAAKELAVLEPSSSVWRVALSNVYAARGKWEKAVETRAGLRKEGGWSSVNVEGWEFRFMAGDTKHPKSVVIYEILGGLQNHMRDGIQAAVESSYLYIIET